jgi:hypothetical protein
MRRIFQRKSLYYLRPERSYFLSLRIDLVRCSCPTACVTSTAVGVGKVREWRKLAATLGEMPQRHTIPNDPLHIAFGGFTLWQADTA